MKVRILIIGEGDHELGQPPQGSGDGPWPLKTECLPALPCLVHRILSEPTNVAYFAKKKGIPIRRIHGDLKRHTPSQLPGHGRQLLWALRDADQDGYDAVAYVMDRDRQDERDTATALNAGRDAFCAESPTPCAVGVAVETFDAWMIADQAAVRTAGGKQEECHSNPERLNGTESSGNHAKCYAKRAFGEGALSDAYARVAAIIRIEHLRIACKDGFAPFAKEVEKLSFKSQ